MCHTMSLYNEREVTVILQGKTTPVWKQWKQHRLPFIHYLKVAEVRYVEQESGAECELYQPQIFSVSSLQHRCRQMK